jgi:putative membrane protein
MRWFHLAVIVVLAFVTLVFALQNFQSVDVSLFGLGIQVPLALLIVIIYVLGAATGGSLLALVRWSIQGARAIP